MSNFSELIAEYLAGPELLRRSLVGFTPAQLNQRPVSDNPAVGHWSCREIVCHIADFEPIYLDRMMRVVAFEQPQYFSADENVFVQQLAYDHRDLEEELALIEACRKHWVRVLRALPDTAFARQGIHSEAGPQTLEKLLRNITRHIPHHVAFIAEKRRLLAT